MTNAKTRKAYDSQEPFDDSYPDGSELKTDADFYTVFAPVFERNSKYVLELFLFLENLNLLLFPSSFSLFFLISFSGLFFLLVTTSLTVRWSIDKVVVTLGDEKTNINQVNKFYTFWYAVRSWRDFSYLDEYDPEEAESREEKRWMERRNAKERLKREGEEKLRLRTFVDVAYKFDPRIRSMKEVLFRFIFSS